MNRKIVLLVHASILLLSFIGICLDLRKPLRASPREWTVDDDGPADFHTIQEAINAANEGDTITVSSGTYHKNVVVNKSLMLIGENRDATIVDGDGTVVHIIADNVCISRFTIQNRGEEPWNCGIYVQDSDDCKVTENTITRNKYAIRVNRSSGNTIYHNNFMGNLRQVWIIDSPGNVWDNGCGGNYWSNYSGDDINNDGVGDTNLPHVGVDYYPLMSPYMLGDVNHDAVVDIRDITMIAMSFGSSIGDEGWNCHADLDENGVIDIRDITAAAENFGKCACTEEEIYVGFTLMPASAKYPPSYWVKVANQISLKVPGSRPIASWAVGIIRSNTKCTLYFPKPDGLTINDPHIEFVKSTDISEPYLDAFDTAGIRVRLTVQPGDADVSRLIDILMFQYGHHRCIHGIGIDVEWFQSSSYTNGKPVSNTEASNWLAKLRTYNPKYKLYLVHWQTSKMPTTHIYGVVYLNDAQNFPAGVAGMMSSFNRWSTAFSDAEVAYAVGYTKDKDWWSTYVDPISTVMNEVATISNCESIYWWAKTIYELFPP